MSIFTLRNSVDLPHSLADCISKLGTPDGYPAVRKLVPTGRACKEVGRERVWITDDDLKGDTDVSLLSLPAAGAGDGAPAGARSVERVDYEVESEVKVVLLNVKVGRAESHVWDEKVRSTVRDQRETRARWLTVLVSIRPAPTPSPQRPPRAST